MLDEIDRQQVPIPTVKRFPSYLRILRQAKENGLKHISATMLAEELSLKPIQVRKDISCTGIEGKPKIGFDIDELILCIRHVLGWDNTTDALVVGAGNLGKAIAGYAGFEAYGLRIVAAFDKDESKVGQRIGGLTIMPLDTINSYIKTHRVSIAVITVPASQAQAVADLLVKCGIRGIWNFAPKDLKLPDDVVMQRTDLATSFAVLSVKLRKKIQDNDNSLDDEMDF
ncbi:MAG: redox-sensing transcriptional repressor Rex [Candidatus Ornithospirochaeta sp.]|nr:redox-sensing transcriptional repressor Rex [Candidatus Ornithospirochaeta sp.]